MFSGHSLLLQALLDWILVGYFAQKNTKILTELPMKLYAKRSKIVDNIYL